MHTFDGLLLNHGNIFMGSKHLSEGYIDTTTLKA